MLVLSPAPVLLSKYQISEQDDDSTCTHLSSTLHPLPATNEHAEEMSNSFLFYGGDVSDESQEVIDINEAARYTEESVKILIAILYTVKTHLRTDWGVNLSPGTSLTPDGQVMSSATYNRWLPENLRGHEQQGLALTLELAVFIEAFIGRGVEKNWFHNAAASSMLASLNQLVNAYGDMETIRLTPIPVAHLIHQRQTLALFCLLLPLAIVSEIGWQVFYNTILGHLLILTRWSIPLVAFVAFTLYGIEGIAQTFEDPFAKVKGDVDLDNVVEDTRREVEVLVDTWRTSKVGRPQSSLHEKKTWMFVPRSDMEHERLRNRGLRVSDTQ